MGNIQVLKDAVQWAKDNPGLHDQGWYERCVIGHYICSQTPDLSPGDVFWQSFAHQSGISGEEAEKLWRIRSNGPGIAYAESLIAKYDTPEVAVSEFEYVLFWSDYEVFTSTDETIARVKAQGARDLLNVINGGDQVKLIKRPIKPPVEEEISF